MMVLLLRHCFCLNCGKTNQSVLFTRFVFLIELCSFPVLLLPLTLEMMRGPLEECATEFTQLEWLLSVASLYIVFQILTVSPSEPGTSLFLSEEDATASIPSSCPVNRLTADSLSTSASN